MWLNPFQWLFNFIQVGINGYLLYVVTKLYRAAHTHVEGAIDITMADDDVQPK